MQLNRDQLFFAYFMDCQTPQKPGGGKDQTWDIAERAVRGLVELFAERNLTHGLGLCIEPEVAWRQADIFREMADQGAWLALHFQARGYRPHGADHEYDWEKPLAFYEHDEQRELLRVARDDWEQALGRSVDTFGACCAMANDDTHPILDALGFRQSYTSVPGRYNPAWGQRWWGAFPHSRHCSSKSRLVPGELQLYEVPNTRTLNPQWREDGTSFVVDSRAEHEQTIEQTLEICVAAVNDMLRCDHPLLYLYIPTHNTWDVGDRSHPRRQAVVNAIDAAHLTAQQFGLELVPATLQEMHAEADRLGAY